MGIGKTILSDFTTITPTRCLFAIGTEYQPHNSQSRELSPYEKYLSFSSDVPEIVRNSLIAMLKGIEIDLLCILNSQESLHQGSVLSLKKSHR